MPYHNFKTLASDEYGSFETFEVRKGDDRWPNEAEGWYWWACYPGCLPDAPAIGPFKSEQEAIDDANGI